MLSKFLVLLTTVAMIVINLLSNAIPFNNKTTAEISDSFKVFFVPAGYVFAIWGVIYLGLIAFNVYLFQNKELTPQIKKTLPFVIFTNIFNSIWIFLWHYGYITLSVLVIVLLLISLGYIYLQLHKQATTGKRLKYLVMVPVSIYFSWVSVATIANITAALYNLNWDGFGINGELWASLLVLIAALIAITLVFKYKDSVYALVIIWSVFGIYNKFPSTTPLNVVCLAACLLVLAVVVYTIARNLLNKNNV